MTVALVGGIDRLKSHYKSAAEEHNIDLRIFTAHISDLICKIAQVDAVIMFTDLVSHQSAKQVYKFCRSCDVCLICSHNSSLSAARRCLCELKNMYQKASTSQSNFKKGGDRGKTQFLAPHNTPFESKI